MSEERVLLRIGGESFQCACGCLYFVATDQGTVYRCFSCGAEYGDSTLTRMDRPVHEVWLQLARRKLVRQLPHCDAALSGIAPDDDFPCIKPVGHSSKRHLYDTAVVVDRDLESLLIKFSDQETALSRLRSYDPCQGAGELHSRHLEVCVPWYEYRDQGMEESDEGTQDPQGRRPGD